MADFDTDYTTFPVCPKCGEADQDWWDGLEPKNDGDEWESTCSNCDCEYRIIMSVEVTFCTDIKAVE